MSALTRRSVFLYALPAAAMAIPTLPVFVLLPTFYHEHTGLALATIGLVLLITRLLDGLTDVIAARVCDFPLFNQGRRHGWIALGAALVTPGLLLLFNPPQSAGVAWLTGASLLVYLGWTLIQVPHQAWMADLTHDYQERNRLSIHREAAGLVGLVLSASLPAIFTQFGADQAQSFRWMSISVLLLGLVTFVGLWTLPKLDNPIPKAPQWRDLLKNRLFLRLNAGWGLNGVANGMAAVLFPMVVTTGFAGDQQDRAIFLLLYFGAALLGMPLVLKLSKTIDKHTLWVRAMYLAILVFACTPFLSESAYLGFVLVCLLTGLTLGADLALPPAIQADLVDQDRVKHGQERPSVFFAAQSLITKLALGVSAAIATGLLMPVQNLLEFSGFASQTDTAERTALLLIYAWLPCVFKLSACWLLKDFSFTRQYGDEIRQALTHSSRRAT